MDLMKYDLFKNHMTGAAVSLGAECIRFIKFSFIVGSETAFFSASHWLRPLTGLYSGTIMSFGILAARTLFNVIALKMTPFLAPLYHIPTFCASLYWAIIPHAPTKLHRLLMALLPIGCFISFAVHPIGGQAVSYACLWIIPLCSIIIAHNNVFIHALASTFVAHAVGSVIWLYTIGPVVPELWKALIPVAIVERLLFASGMTLCVYAIMTAQAYSFSHAFQNLFNRKKAILQ